MIANASSLESFGPLLKILVGKEEKVFHVNEAFLTERSKFFKKAMNSKWLEGQTKVVRLVEDDPDIFEIYINLVYTGRLPIFDNATTMRNLPKMIEDGYSQLSHLYVLAEKLQDVKAKNSTVDAIIDIFHSHIYLGQEYRKKFKPPIPSLESIRIMYNGTPSSQEYLCHGREILVALVAWYAAPAYFEKKYNHKDFPAEFLGDLSLELLSVRDPEVGLSDTDICHELCLCKFKEDYHEKLEDDDSGSPRAPRKSGKCA